MKKIQVAKATSVQLDWLVATIEGWKFRLDTEFEPVLVAINADGVEDALHDFYTGLSPTTDWALGGPILTNARISRTIDHSGLWVAYWTDGYTEGDEGKKWMQCDRSELVAGLRCYVASKLGKEVEVPNELA